MPRILMVRHGEAAAGWGDDPDPGLSPKGWTQALEAAGRLHPLKPASLVTSPLRRCRETAQVLADICNLEPVVDATVGEVNAPPGTTLDQRPAWLRKIFQGTWSETDPRTRAWKDQVIATLVALKQDTVVFSHFVATNAAVGAATGDDRVVCFRPDNCSITVFESDGLALTLIEKGHEADTRVN